MSRPAVTPSVDHWLRGRGRLRPARRSLNFYRFAKSLISLQPIQVSRAFSDWSDKLSTFVPAVESFVLRGSRDHFGKRGLKIWSQRTVQSQASGRMKASCREAHREALLWQESRRPADRVAKRGRHPYYFLESGRTQGFFVYH